MYGACSHADRRSVTVIHTLTDMTMFKKIVSFLTVVVAVCACGNVTNIAYIQDLNDSFETSAGDKAMLRARPDDKLSIVVSSKDPLLADLFNLPIVAHRVGYSQSSSLSTSQQVSCYTVDPEGYIDFPILGKVHIEGLTRSEIADTIKGELISRDLIKDPVVTVEFGNHYVSVLGEVTRQGRYALDRDQTSIFDVLAMAGDLTIYGERENVKVLRETDGKQRIYEVDLTSGEKLLKSPVFYMQQGDVIYVEPNKTRTLQSTLNGNSVRSTSFWFSLGSLLTSVTSVLMVVLR